MTKTFTGFFSLCDHEKEELWLRSMHKRGWRLVHMTVPCFYSFESCAPEDVIYRLEYKNEAVSADYVQMYADFGWEYVQSVAGWNYFRKSAAAAQAPEESEIFSSGEDKLAMVEKIYKTRMLPLFVIFCCCLMPNFYKTLSGDFRGPWGIALSVFWWIMFALYMFLFIHNGTGLKKLRNKYEQENNGR